MWPTILVVIFLCSPTPLLNENSSPVRLHDHSDWWSILNENFAPPHLKAQGTAIEEGNFQIAGVTLGGGQFESVSARFGKAQAVQRGDGSTGREQVCLEFEDGTKKVYLIFEFGEVEASFYLFSGGPRWKGSGFCRRSTQPSAGVKTASGLSLGLSRNQVEAILGKPDFELKNRLIYSREIKERTSTQEFQKLRSEYPQTLSEEVAHQKFDFQSVIIYVEARFSATGLSYLAVSRTSF